MKDFSSFQTIRLRKALGTSGIQWFLQRITSLMGTGKENLHQQVRALKR